VRGEVQPATAPFASPPATSSDTARSVPVKLS